jgi:hypothetical protein
VAKPQVTVLSPVAAESAPDLFRDVLHAARWQLLPSDPEDDGLLVARDRLGLPHWVVIRFPGVDVDDAAVAVMGGLPLVGFELQAQTSDPRAHQSLGSFALTLAEASSGWIDLGGALGDTTDGVEVAYAYLQSVALGPGVHPIEYETTRGTAWFHVLMDVSAFRAWLDHPDFHLVC